MGIHEEDTDHAEALFWLIGLALVEVRVAQEVVERQDLRLWQDVLLGLLINLPR